MTATTAQRRLATILCADVAGYSALMERDEEGTLARLKEYRALFEGRIAEHGGRVFGGAGDSLLAEFASPLAAVRCAVAAQTDFAPRNEALAPDRRMRFRIGINLGDVMVEGDNLYGDGVNVAARLEALAEPGSLCISGAVYELAGSRLDLAFADMGERQVKNIARPIRVYRLAGGPGRTPAPPPADKPSIAVLPFENMSGDAAQSYFSDGITEDIITELSRFRTLFVIARNSSFAFRGKAANVRQVGRDLGVLFVVEGSVRRAGDKLRITAQLIDAVSGHHLWAERYDRGTEDVFAVQDDVTQRIVSTVAARLDEAELAHTRGKPPASLSAYDLWLRGRKAQERTTPEGDAEAKGYFERAIAIDPTYARAHAGLAEVAYSATVYSGWGTPAAKDYEPAFRHAQKAVALDDTDAAPHAVLGWVHLVRREFERARKHWDHANFLNPNDADIVMSRATALVFLGEPEAAIEQAQLAMRLNPYHPDWYLSDLAVAYFAARSYAEVSAVFERIPELYPHTPAWRAAAAAHLGRMSEAKAHAAQFVANIKAMWAGDPAAGPGEYGEWLLDRLPFRRPEDSRHLRQGLRLAGLPV